MSFALLFAGQGTQHAAMLPWLESQAAAQPALRAMEHYTGADWRDRLGSAETVSSNAFAQPLITGTSLAAWAVVQAHLQGQCKAAEAALPALVAGYSVGEMAAFACAQVFDTEAALALSVRRAALMDAAVAGMDTGLLSVSGIRVQSVLAFDARLGCAIHIADDHGIFAGESRALDACSGPLAERGATCKRLDVRLASHSRWMQQAAAQFAQVLQPLAWQDPVCPVVLDVSGTPQRRAQVLKQGLSQQLCTTVQWAACMDAIAERGVRCVLEIGAGSALAKLWNTRHGHIPARALEDFRDAAGAAEWIARNTLA